MLEPLAPTQQLLQTIGEVPQRSSYVAPRRRPVDEARHVERFGLGQTERLNDVNIPFSLLGPEHLLDGIIERVHPRFDRSLPPEFANRVVEEKRCR